MGNTTQECLGLLLKSDLICIVTKYLFTAGGGQGVAPERNLEMEKSPSSHDGSLSKALPNGRAAPITPIRGYIAHQRGRRIKQDNNRENRWILTRRRAKKEVEMKRRIEENWAARVHASAAVAREEGMAGRGKKRPK